MSKKTSKNNKSVKNAKSIADKSVQNGLQGAIFGQGFPGGGYGFGGPNTPQVSQPGQIFNDLRWYFVSNFRQMLSQAYCELGLIQTLVDVPVDDALRGGVEIRSKQLSPHDLDRLRDVMDREDDVNTIGKGLKWTRLFGGGGILVITDQNFWEPLNTAAIGPNTPLEFRALDMWELYFDLQSTYGYDSIQQDENYQYFSYYGQKVHKSRVMKMVGRIAPSFLRPRLRGWGFSEVEAIVRSVNQYLEGTNLIYELTDQAKLDVFGIKNLTNTLMSPGGTAQVHERIQIANMQKDYQHALVMDSEDSYQQKNLAFSGLADVMKEIRMQVASDLRMPLTKLFGISAAGFNSGEDDIEIYNAMIESTIRSKAKKDILQVVELRCQKMFGFIPGDLSVAFKPLRVMSGKDEQEVKTAQLNNLLAAMTAGAISLEEFRIACNKDALLGIQLENDNLPAGADELGNVEGNDDAAIDEDSQEEENLSSLADGNPPPAKD